MNGKERSKGKESKGKRAVTCLIFSNDMFMFLQWNETASASKLHIRKHPYYGTVFHNGVVANIIQFFNF